MGDMYEALLVGGGPWGIRLQGGKDFGVPLNVARVTPGSKAAIKGIMAGDTITAINGVETSSLTHMDAQNAIKTSGQQLQLTLKKGKGVSLGDVKQVGSGGFAAQPNKTMYTTQVTHSAGVDHKFNSKPKAFGAATTSPSSGAQTVQAKKFDPSEYARRKKEELQKYKEEQNKPTVPDSDVLKMLQNTKVSENTDGKKAGSFSRLQESLDNEGQWADQEKSFRMTADGTDLSDVSPGSKAVMDDLKNYGGDGLRSSGAPSGGSRSFKALQQMTSNDEDLPPPPPELMNDEYNRAGFGNSGANAQSGTFKMLQKHVESGSGDQIRTVFDQAPADRGKAVPAGQSFTPAPKNSYAQPNSSLPSGPNFRVGRASAPTFKPSSAMRQENKAPPPPAVNAGEVVNPNSKSFQPNQSAPSAPSSAYQPSSAKPAPYAVPSSNTPYSPPAPASSSPYSGMGNDPAPSSGVHVIKSTRAPQAAPAPASENELYCGACQQPLSDGPFVSAIGKTWHPDHFCCSSCNVSLQNQAFVEENNQLFCEKCYNSYYAPKCAHCNQAIIGNCVNALGKSWHPDHFVCSFCNRGFGSDGFLVDSGKPYCEKCFGDLFSVKCGKCNNAITGGEKYVEALNKNWHSTCFTCNKCNCRLEGSSFFMSAGMPYCQAHKSGM